MKQELTEEQLKSVSGGVSSEGRYEVYRDVYYFNNDETSGHGFYIIIYSDGTEEKVEF